MTKGRLAIVGVVIIAFAVMAGVVIYANQSRGGQDVTINVSVTGANKMSPSDLSAHENDMVTINITSDTTGEVHLHGYDIPFDCTAGKVTSHTFKADKTGDFEIEWETTSAHLGHLVVAP
jgi:FtsP/CotA-like multicopper oxidase with cupredoxin domain